MYELSISPVRILFFSQEKDFSRARSPFQQVHELFFRSIFDSEKKEHEKKQYAFILKCRGNELKNINRITEDVVFFLFFQSKKTWTAL